MVQQSTGRSLKECVSSSRPTLVGLIRVITKNRAKGREMESSKNTVKCGRVRWPEGWVRDSGSALAGLSDVKSRSVATGGGWADQQKGRSGANCEVE
jgi:hypothetical protein